MTNIGDYNSLTRTFRLSSSPDPLYPERVETETVHVTIALSAGVPVGMDCKCARVGETDRGLYAILGGMATLAMAHGASLADVARVMRHTSFGAMGLTGDDEIRTAKSLPDFIAAWLETLCQR